MKDWSRSYFEEWNWHCLQYTFEEAGENIEEFEKRPPSLLPELIRAGQANVASILRAKLHCETSPVLNELLELILSYRPDSFVTSKNYAYICFVRGEIEKDWDLFLLPCRVMADNNPCPSPITSEFFKKFGGLCENLPPDCLLFFDNIDPSPSADGLSTSWPIYARGDEEVLFEHVDGRIEWVSAYKHVKWMFESFEDFLEMYLQLRTKFGRVWFDVLIGYR